MGFISSNLALATRVEEASLYFYQGNLTHEVTHLKPLLETVERQIFSRVVALLISPAAVIDLAIHTLLLPFTVIYAIGSSIYYCECNFSLPWQHFQRMRDAVFPILFGSVFGLIHPYLGAYAAEPAKKHIATGILLSNTDKDKFDSVCSPVTTMEEISSLLSDLPADLKLTDPEAKLLRQVKFWEEEFEKIQSIDFFNLSLSFKIGNQIQKAIDDLEGNPVLKEVVKRIALLTYPIFILCDISILLFTNVISVGVLAVKLLGGQSPAYLEKAWTPEVMIYNVVKIPLFLVSATLGFVIAWVNPEIGIQCSKKPLEWFAKVPFLLKMCVLKHHLKQMKKDEMILLPAVETYPDDDKRKMPLLPTYGSHMRYLLIQKKGRDQYQAELIERGKRHGKSDTLSHEDMGELMEKTLSLRYAFGRNDHSVLDSYSRKTSIANLGTQTGINNCILTNLFATVEVLRHRAGKNDFGQICTETKTLAMKRYYLYAYDYYPFGKTHEVVDEINNIFQNAI